MNVYTLHRYFPINSDTFVGQYCKPLCPNSMKLGIFVSLYERLLNPKLDRSKHYEPSHKRYKCWPRYQNWQLIFFLKHRESELDDWYGSSEVASWALISPQKNNCFIQKVSFCKDAFIDIYMWLINVHLK